MASMVTAVEWASGVSKFFAVPTVPALTLICTLFVLVYAFLELSASFIQPAKHFPRTAWLWSSSRPKVDVPLIKVNDAGDYAEALGRGARKVRGFAFIIMLQSSIDDRGSIRAGRSASLTPPTNG